MFRLGNLPARPWNTFCKRRLEQDLSTELQVHLDLLTEEHIRRGMDPRAAAHAARRQFGGLEQTKEIYRDQRGLPFLETLLQDLQYALRMLRKSPGFTAVAVLTLALGIGANTAMFSVMEGVALSSLPYFQPDRLVMVWENNPRFPRVWDSYPNFLDWQRSLVPANGRVQ